MRALVRSERAAAAVRALPEHARPEVAIVDYTDAASIARQAAGCDAAVHLVGILKETRANRYADAHERPCEALAAAADRCGLRRIVALSILGADARLAERVPRLARTRRRDAACARRRPPW